MRRSSLARGLEAMASMEKGKPYALRPEDAKRRLADELARLCSDAGVKPVVIGGLAVGTVWVASVALVDRLAERWLLRV